jgi:hypothetical protein
MKEMSERKGRDIPLGPLGGRRIHLMQKLVRGEKNGEKGEKIGPQVKGIKAKSESAPSLSLTALLIFKP